MENPIAWKKNSMMKDCCEGVSTVFLNAEEIGKAKKFHMSFPIYQPTPLRSLHHLARQLGVAGIYVKDESWRFGLNAFKVLLHFVPSSVAC